MTDEERLLDRVTVDYNKLHRELNITLAQRDSALNSELRWKVLAIGRGGEVTKLQRRLHLLRLKWRATLKANAEILEQSKRVAHLCGPHLRTVETQVDVLKKTIAVGERLIGRPAEHWDIGE